MTNLEGIVPFAEGGNKKCFIHPNKPDRCLKVVHPGLLQIITNKRPWFGTPKYDSFKNTVRIML
tara:strand:- start:28 stop:219 length:192 start_codon:yes stop_codon:yes gene_type:complete